MAFKNTKHIARLKNLHPYLRSIKSKNPPNHAIRGISFAKTFCRIY